MGDCKCPCKPNWAHIGFVGTTPDLFQRIQWTKNIWIFFGYRSFMMAFVVAWFIYGIFENTNPDFWQELTNWSEVVMVLYFLYTFILAIYAVAVRNKTNASQSGSLPWYYIINWILFNVAAVSAFLVSLFFWAALAPGRSREENLRPSTFHVHATNSMLLFVETLMIAHSVRIFHVVHSFLYGIVYLIFILILHGTKVNSAIYPVLDWENNVGIAIGFSAMALIVFPIIFQLVIFGLYRLRLLVFQKAVEEAEELPSVDNSTTPADVKKGKVNLGFQETP